MLRDTASVMLWCATIVSAQAPSWQMHNTPTYPPSRAGAAIAHDTTRQRFVMFGGDGTTTTLSDTWLFDGADWSAASPAVRPSARSEHAMAHDAARQRIVLFGGVANGIALGDLWEWDGVVWAPTITGSGPSPRGGHAMTYDETRQRVLLFGGGAGTQFADTWEWDGTNWTQRTPALSPPPRAQHALAYDPIRARAVLTGGHFGTTVRDDVWEWDGNVWTAAGTLPVVAGTVPGRLGHGMCWHAPTQRIVLASGYTASTGTGFVDLSDSWEWNGSAWSQLTSLTLASFDHAMAADPVVGTLLHFGGRRMVLQLPYSLTHVYTDHVASATSYGTGCCTPPLGLATSTANARPFLGNGAFATITNAPTFVIAVVFGTSNVSSPALQLPKLLTGFGMTGCMLWHQADAGSLPAQAGVLPNVVVGVPMSAALIGAHLHLQAFAYAPGQNPAGVTASNAVDWHIGYR